MQDRQDMLPILPMQHFMLKHAGLDEFNLARVIALSTPVTLKLLRECVSTILSCQPYLRALLVRNENKYTLEITEKDICIIDEIFVLHQEENKIKDSIDHFIMTRSKHIHIEKGPILSITLIQLANNDQKIVLVCSHLFFDIYSIRLFVQLIERQIYTKHLDINLLANKVKDEIKSIQQLYINEYSEKQSFQYWLNRLTAENIVSGETWHSPQMPNLNKDEIHACYTINTEESMCIVDCIKKYQLDFDSLIIGAFLNAFAEFAKQNDFVIQLHHHGRMTPGKDKIFNNVITWLNISWPLILKFDNEKSLHENVKAIQKSITYTRENSYAYNINYYRSEEYKQLFVPPDLATIEYSYSGQTRNEIGHLYDCPLYAKEYTHGKTFSPTLKRYRQIFVRPHWHYRSLIISLFYNKHIMSEEVSMRLLHSMYDRLRIMLNSL